MLANSAKLLLGQRRAKFFCDNLFDNSMARIDILKKEAFIRELIAEGKSKAYIASQMHCKPETLNRYLAMMGIAYNGNQFGLG